MKHTISQVKARMLNVKQLEAFCVGIHKKADQLKQELIDSRSIGFEVHKAIIKKQSEKIEQLEQQNKELLETLIENIKFVQRYSDFKMSIVDCKKDIKLIEKIKGKTWEQINE